jgi:hypothetical protein
VGKQKSVSVYRSPFTQVHWMEVHVVAGITNIYRPFQAEKYEEGWGILTKSEKSRLERLGLELRAGLTHLQYALADVLGDSKNWMPSEAHKGNWDVGRWMYVRTVLANTIRLVYADMFF